MGRARAWGAGDGSEGGGEPDVRRASFVHTSRRAGLAPRGWGRAGARSGRSLSTPRGGVALAREAWTETVPAACWGWPGEVEEGWGARGGAGEGLAWIWRPAGATAGRDCRQGTAARGLPPGDCRQGTAARGLPPGDCRHRDCRQRLPLAGTRWPAPTPGTDGLHRWPAPTVRDPGQSRAGKPGTPATGQYPQKARSRGP